MRLTAITLIVLSATIFSGVAKSDETPKRSTELQVLDRYVGTWDLKLTLKPAGGEATTVDVVSHRAWTLGGTFIRIEDAINPKSPEAKETQILLTYDPEAKNYPGVLMDGPNRSQLTGTWDAKTTTMHWKGEGADGNTSVAEHRFIGNDRAEVSAVIKNPDGMVTLELSWIQTRRK